VKPNELPARPSPLDTALDAALARALRPPAPDADFRIQLSAALVRAGRHEDTEATRVRLERERREGLAELESGYLRLRRRTLGTLIGAAFAAGAGLTLLLPWLKTTLGADAMLAVAVLGGAAGLLIAGTSRLVRAALVRRF
jgi:hypothetical protein